mgnify:CR=1 FL=1
MEKKHKLLTKEQASIQLHILPRTLSNPRSIGIGVPISQTGEVRGLLEMVASSENNTLTHTGKVKGLLD